MLAGGDIVDLVDRIEAGTIHVRAPTSIILLCGGEIKVESPKPTSLRDSFTRIYTRPTLKDYKTVTPEEFQIFVPFGQYRDWLSFESEFAQIVDLIVLFSESYGSSAELGAFSMVEEIALRLLVVIDDWHYNRDSFIRHGPLLRLRNKYGLNSVCVVNRDDLKIPNISTVSEIDLDRLTENLVLAISARKNDYRERTTFDAKRPGHVIKLIVGLIQHYGALTAIELDIYLYALNIPRPTGKLADYLFCAESAGWIAKDTRGNQEYFCAITGIQPAIEYTLRKDIAKADKDRDRWRASVIDYWKQEEPVRFASIQAAIKKALQ